MNASEMCQTYELSPALKDESKKLRERIKNLEDRGIVYGTHLEPVQILLSYLSDPQGIEEFYDILSTPNPDSNEAAGLLDHILTVYAGRNEYLLRNGLVQGDVSYGSDELYCEIRLSPLASGPVVRGLSSIFGKNVLEKIKLDPLHIPWDETYVCGCHNLSSNAHTPKAFLVGNIKTMQKFIPGIKKISYEASIEDICPYEADCPFKEGYKKGSEKLALRIIDDPLQNFPEVFQKRIIGNFGEEVCREVMEVAKSIYIFNIMKAAEQNDPYDLNGREEDMSYFQ